MYKLQRNMTGELVSVQRLSDGAFIPFEPTNIDYQEYQCWLDEGNEPLAALPSPIPTEA